MMVEPSLTFDPPPDADAESGEQIQARLDEIRQMPWLEPDWEEATRLGTQVVERYWHRYCSGLGVHYKEALLREEPAIYMSFLEWMKKNSRKKGGDTYDVYWRRMCGYFSLLAEREMSNNVMKQMRRYLNTRFRRDGKVCIRHKEKHTMSAEDLGILLRQLWLYTRLSPLGRLLLQEAVVLLASAITGTRPRILVPPNSIAMTSEAEVQHGQGDGQTPKKKYKRQDDFQSDIPKYVRYDDLPRALCYRDIELFVIRNPEGGSDVLVAVIDFRNIKGTQQGAEGTKFMMHCDYQLAYCPITYILALAHADRAFKNERLTPELILRLRVPPRLHTLPIVWKEDMLQVPLLRHIETSAYGVRVHPKRPMSYDTSNKLLQQLGTHTGYDFKIDHYAFRRWTANEANREAANYRAFTDQERNRILGHSGTWIFEKFYNDHFIHRDVQSVVLLRPPQAELIRAVAQMNRNRDPKAPKALTDQQRQKLCEDSHLIKLRKERDALKREICFGGQSLSSARGTEPYRRHKDLGKAITRRRDQLRRMGWEEVKQSYHSAMPVLEVDKQIDAMLGVEPDEVPLVELEGDWTPPPPTFWCAEHERIADAFFGPTADVMTGDEALSRRIQVINDLVALCELREPPRRGPKMDWSKVDAEIYLDGTDNGTADSDDGLKLANTPPTPDLAFPTDQCIFCVGDDSLRTFHLRAKQRPDSLRRHFENQHLIRFGPGDYVICPHRVCKEKGTQPFSNREVWLNHAAVVHKYDLKVQLNRLSGK